MNNVTIYVNDETNKKYHLVEMLTSLLVEKRLGRDITRPLNRIITSLCLHTLTANETKVLLMNIAVAFIENKELKDLQTDIQIRELK